MNKTGLFLATLILFSFAAPALAKRTRDEPVDHAKNDSVDMFIQTRIAKPSLSWLIEKTRVMMANVKFDDHLTGDVKLDAAPEFALKDQSEDAQFKQFRKMLTNVFKVDVDHSTVRIRVPALHYEIQTIQVNPKNLTVDDPNLVLSTQALISGIKITLPQGIMVDFRIPNPKSKELESYFTATIDPIFIDIPNTLPPVTFDADVGVKRNASFNYSLLKYNLDLIPAYVQDHQKEFSILAGTKEKVPLGTANIQVNPVVIRINRAQRTIDLDAFKPIVQKKFPDIMKWALSLMGQSLKNTMAPNLLTTVFSNSNRSDLIVNNESIYTHFMTEKFVKPNADQLALNIAVDNCTFSGFKKYGESCLTYEPRQKAVRKISSADRAAAHQEVELSLAQGKSDVALSVSEEYLNRLLKTTIQADLWSASLAEHDIEVGPKGAFVILNKKTATPELYLDTLYTGGPGLQSLVVNERHPFRFPLRIGTALKFELREGIPFMILKSETLLSTEDEIINGIEEYGLESRLIGTFRKKIARMIIELGEQIEGQTAFEVSLPFFKNVGLEKTWYEASEHGRLNLFFKL